MKKKWRVLIVASLVVLCVCLYLGCRILWWSPSYIEAKRYEVKAILDADKRKASAMQSKRSRYGSLYERSAAHTGSRCEIGIGRQKFDLLQEAASKHEINEWARDNGIRWNVLKLWSSKVERILFFIGPGGTSGLHSWVVYIYSYSPSRDRDSKPWKLLYVGIVGRGTADPHAVDRVYIDEELGCLVFVSGSTGKVSYAIPISHELELMEKH